MIIEMFNGWYFLWLLICTGATAGLYFALRGRSSATQKMVLFGLLVVGVLLHFLKAYIPPYSVDESRMLRDSWFINICGANIALFPFMFWSKSEKIKDYMFYIGVISGLIALFYPQEPIAKLDQLAEQLDIVRFYYHHWMVLAVPMLMALLKIHQPSYRRILCAPTGLLIMMLFIILNQVFQSELGFVPLRDRSEFFIVGYKNTSYIWGPGTDDFIGNIFAKFTPDIFKTVPVGEYAGQEKYWPWFWLIVPAYVLITPIALAIAAIFDRSRIAADLKNLKARLSGKKSLRV